MKCKKKHGKKVNTVLCLHIKINRFCNVLMCVTVLCVARNVCDASECSFTYR